MSEPSLNTPSIQESETFRKWLIEHLHLGEVTVGFTKKDGEFRSMKCTLSENLIPQDKMPKGTGTRKTSETTQSVFDVNKQEWRSFLWANVQNVSFDFGNPEVEEFEKPVDTTGTIE